MSPPPPPLSLYVQMQKESANREHSEANADRRIILYSYNLISNCFISVTTTTVKEKVP